MGIINRSCLFENIFLRSSFMFLLAEIGLFSLSLMANQATMTEKNIRKKIIRNDSLQPKAKARSARGDDATMPPTLPIEVKIPVRVAYRFGLYLMANAL